MYHFDRGVLFATGLQSALLNVSVPFVAFKEMFTLQHSDRKSALLKRVIKGEWRVLRSRR